ncbi:MAG: ribonuclease HII [Bacteroidetes bacterium]|nr:ribonuclease HII [Bacteroidota bacterium]
MLKKYYDKSLIEAGCDEAGRGCMAGPVYAAAVILPKSFSHPLLNDSKKLTDAQRKILRPIIEQEALAYAVASVSEAMIDKINILNASIRAMHLAVAKLKTEPALLLIDGNRFKPYKNVQHHCIIGGDGKYASIAAASILAKTYRDDFMDKLHDSFPVYGWLKNKGYGTLDHRIAMEKHGLCEYHRKSFKLKSTQLAIAFK